ncbi:hypothetical protein [Priestia megaterium]|uniref:hypothetical protein n=1 Tax=Priestia megaterium TaxID=1404 RepID=UPI0012B7240A|nr:hypothetical protein [Priestia megaterium]
MEYAKELSTKNVAKIGKTIKINLSMLIVFFLFFCNETVRSFMLPPITYMNIPFLICATFLILKFWDINGIKVRELLLLFFLSLISFISFYYSNQSISTYIMLIANLLLPLYLFSIKINGNQALSILKGFTRIFNILIIVLIMTAILDYISNSAIQLLMAKTIFSSSEMGKLINLEHSWGIYRFYSFLGHPLQNARYFLIFFIVNNIYAKYDKFLMKSYLISLITMLGLILCGSKTSIIIGLVLIVFFSNIKRYKFLYTILIVLAIVVLINTPLFQENLKLRFLDSMHSGDLTTGRSGLVDLLKTSGIQPNWLLGGGPDYSREVALSLNGKINNFEYPFIMLPFDYGIVGTAIIYILIFLKPLLKFLQNKQFYIFVCFLAITLNVNTNNGIANLGADYFAQLCFIIFIMINLDPILIKKRT